MFQLRDLEFQLAEERKTRIKQETRALATASSSSSTTTSRQLREALPTITEKKPPLAPTRMRMPLRRITNFMPQQPSQGPSKRFSDATYKENNSNNSNRRSSSSMDINTLMKPRRSSIAFRPAPPPSAVASGNNKTLQPRRRVSIATFRPEPSLSASHMNMTTPSRPSSFSFRGGHARKARCSKPFSPDHNLVTPNAMKSSRFVKSPLGGSSSWKPSHPTVVALQKKAVIWSPLKFKNRRPSFIPMRASAASSSSSATDMLRREQ